MTIRDILMGEIIEEYNDRFEKVGQELQAQRDALAAKEADLAARIQALDELLQTNSASLAAAINRKADDERHALGALFLSLGQRLKD